MTADPFPLVVDLDGTLATRDTMPVQMTRLAIRRPRCLPAFTRAVRESRADAKALLWREVGLDVTRLHYSRTLLAHLDYAGAKGRRLVLVTGAHQALAEAVADHVGLFSDVFGSHARHNLTGRRKAEHLVALFGARGFDYAGNAAADVPVWEVARYAIVCNAPRAVRRAAENCSQVIATLDDRRYRGPALQSLIAALTLR